MQHIYQHVFMGIIHISTASLITLDKAALVWRVSKEHLLYIKIKFIPKSFQDVEFDRTVQLQSECPGKCVLNKTRVCGFVFIVAADAINLNSEPERTVSTVNFTVSTVNF